MAPALQQRRTHSLLLISKLLNQRDAGSPFTLVLDSLEQSGKALLTEFINRANAAKTQTILVSFETLRKPKQIDMFVQAWDQSLQAWQKELANLLASDPNRRKLLIFDSLNGLSSAVNARLPQLLSSFISPSISLLALYHLDIPEVSTTGEVSASVYCPPVLTLLRYLATTIFITHSLQHILVRKAARERSLAEPSSGLEEGIEGLVQGLTANDTQGIALEMEHRRKSGRGVHEWYFLPLPGLAGRPVSSVPPLRSKEVTILLEDHPQYSAFTGVHVDPILTESRATFELGLTERQKKDREGIVLPYFDAQTGAGEGGRILYDMGEEDDFDEEEDEI